MNPWTLKMLTEVSPKLAKKAYYLRLGGAQARREMSRDALKRAGGPLTHKTYHALKSAEENSTIATNLLKKADNIKRMGKL